MDGAYAVRVEAPEFKTFLEREVRLVNQELRRLDVRLEIGAVETTIEVTGIWLPLPVSYEKTKKVRFFPL